MKIPFQLQHVTLDKLRRSRDIECSDSVMEHHPNYPKVWWYSLLKHIEHGKRRCFLNNKQKTKTIQRNK